MADPVIDVNRVAVPPDLLRKMTSEERVFFLLMGHAENQISVMFKVLRFSINNEPEGEIEQIVAGTQSQIILRLLIALMYETWSKLIKERFLNRKNVNVDLASNGNKIVTELYTHFNDSGLINRIRHAFAFHYPDDEYMNSAFKEATGHTDLTKYWNWYISNVRTNTCYYASELVFLHAIMKETGERTLGAAQERLMADATKVYMLLVDLFDEIFQAYIKKYFPSPLPISRVANINGAPNFYKFSIPFYAFVDEADGGSASLSEGATT
jgi:hypothetical protein